MKLKSLISPTVVTEATQRRPPSNLDDLDLSELLDKFMGQNNLWHFEGYQAERNFAKLVGALGYSNTEEFFGDNSGAYEAVIEWIKDRNAPEWKESVADHLLPSDDDEDD